MAPVGPDWARSIEFYWDGASALALRSEGSRSGRRDDRQVRIAVIAEASSGEHDGAKRQTVVDVFDIVPTQGWTRLILLPPGSQRLIFRLERRIVWQPLMTVDLVASEADAAAGQWQFLIALLQIHGDTPQPARNKSILFSEAVGIEVDSDGHLANLHGEARKQNAEIVWAVRSERGQVATPAGAGANLEFRVGPSVAVYPAVVTGFDIAPDGVATPDIGTPSDTAWAIKAHIAKRAPTPSITVIAARPAENDRKVLGAAAGVLVYRQRQAARQLSRTGEPGNAPRVRSLSESGVIAAFQPSDHPLSSSEIEDLRDQLFVTPKDDSNTHVLQLANLLDDDRALRHLISCERTGSDYQRPAFRVELPGAGYGDDVGICHPNKLLRNPLAPTGPLTDIVLFRVQKTGSEGTTLTPIPIAANDPCVKEIRQLAARMNSDGRQRSYAASTEKDADRFTSWLSSLDPSLADEWPGAFDDHWESLMGSVVGPQSLVAFLDLPSRVPSAMHVADAFERYLEDPALFAAIVAAAKDSQDFAELVETTGITPASPLLERIAVALGGDGFLEAKGDIDTQIAVLSLFRDQPSVLRRLIEARVRLGAPPTSVGAIDEVLDFVADSTRAERALQIFRDEPNLFDITDRNKAISIRHYLDARSDGAWSEFLDVRSAAEAVRVAEEKVSKSEQRFAEMMRLRAVPAPREQTSGSFDSRSKEEIRASIEHVRARFTAEQLGSDEQLRFYMNVALADLTRPQLLRVEEGLQPGKPRDDPGAVDQVLDAIEISFDAQGVADAAQRRPNGASPQTRLQRVVEFLNTVVPTYEAAFSGACPRLNQSRLLMKETITQRLESAAGRGSISDSTIADIVRYAELLQASKIHRAATDVADRMLSSPGSAIGKSIGQIHRQLQYFWPIEADETVQQLFEVVERGNLPAEVSALEQSLQPPIFN